MGKTIFWLAIVLLLGVSGLYLVGRFASGTNRDGSPLAPGYLACTDDAKVCDDGSAVGRDPSARCEFYPCPEHVDDDEEPVACTMDARICDDGSAVGREGDRLCAFAPCPGEGTVAGHVTLDPAGEYDGELRLEPESGGVITSAEVRGGHFYATLATGTYAVSTGRVLPRCEGSFTVRADEEHFDGQTTE